jgi:hypothetical protein
MTLLTALHRRDILSLVVPVLLVISAVGNVFQGMSRDRFIAPRAKPSGVANAPEQGVLPPLPLSDLSGKEAALTYGPEKPPTVLYVFSPSCVWCKRNYPMIRQLAVQARSRFRFVALSVTQDGLSEYAAATPLGFPTFGSRSRAALLDYGISSTPTTLVISPNGNVLRRWKGAFVNHQLADVEAYFSVRLGGLAMANP